MTLKNTHIDNLNRYYSILAEFFALNTSYLQCNKVYFIALLILSIYVINIGILKCHKVFKSDF